MRLIAWLLTKLLRKTEGIQAFLIRHIFRAKVSLVILDRKMTYETLFATIDIFPTLHQPA